MAPKRSSLLDEPPPAASSAEEEETSSGEEEKGLSGDGSSSDEEEETQTQKLKKPFALPSTSVIDKKPAHKKSDLAINSQAHQSSSSETKKLFQRLWSEDDEIAILDGIFDYSIFTCSDPASNINAFHNIIKESLHVDVTNAQLVDKIRRLKKKYRKNAERGKNGADPKFSKLHEQKCFQLSKDLWGDEGTLRTRNLNVNGTPKMIQRGSTSNILASPKLEILRSQDAQKVDHNQAPSCCMDGFVAFERSLGGVGLPESFLKPGLELIGQSKRTELEKEWKKLHVAELELFLRRSELIWDQAKLILEAYKSSDK